MILLNDTINVLNPDTLLSYFSGKGRNIDLLSNCNFQEFKYIDGCGEGYFLIKYGDITINEITLNLVKGGTNYKRKLIVTDSIIFEADTSPKVQLIKTAELKYSLESINATRNYNVVDIKTVVGATGALLDPDSTGKTVVQIIQDIDNTIEVVWNPTLIKPINAFIDGLSVREIMDRICMAYGLLWTAEYSTVTIEGTPESRITIYVYAGTSLNTTVSLPPTDVNKPKPLQVYREIDTVYPILDNGVQEPINYFTKKSSSSGGKSINAYNPYFPALYNPGERISVNFFLPGSGTPVNLTQITSVHNYVKPNLENIIKLENYYYVHSHIEPYSHLDPPKALKYTYGQSTSGLRTFLFSGKYPTLPIPEHSKIDRQARNIIATLAYTYTVDDDSIPPLYFFATPQYGLDGYIDTETPLYVINLYKWDFGAIGAVVRLEWDPIHRVWIPLQQEYVCPEEPEDPPPPPPPPVYPEYSPYDYY